MPRLALILSGAVSLGSFEAGVLTELLYLLDLLAKDDEKRHTLDVITGASAGAMTAALVARAVMNDFGDRRRLHEAWVKEIDIRALLASPPPNALLSKTPIERIAGRCLGAPPPHRRDRAAFAPERLFMAFTLSNLSGVDYALEYGLARDRRFISTFFAERRDFVLDDVTAADARYWEAIKRVAIASGSFPLAFAPAMVRADPAAWPGAEQPLPPSFCYVDGGLFNNEPIGDAVRLAGMADGGEVDPGRRFILVDANLNGSTRDRDFDDRASLVATALRLAAVVGGEAAANDWLRAARVNNEAGWRDSLVVLLAEMVRGGVLADAGGVRSRLRASAQAIVRQKRRVFGDRYPQAYLAVAIERTKARHAGLMAGLSPERQDILAHLVFVVNSVAGLEKKQRLALDVIYAEPGETAGDRLGNFGGFFNEEWREHDFRIGRRKAREALPAILGTGPYSPEVGPAGEDLYALPGDFRNVEMKDADPRLREAVRGAAVAKAKALVREQARGKGLRARLAAGALAWLVGRAVKGRVARLLEL